MKKIYLMTAATMVVAVAVLARIAGRLFRRVRRMIDDWVAGAIAYRERRVTQFALRSLSDPELKDFSAYRGNSGSLFHRYRDVKFATRR
jgi:uncharacterized protein YjiS (DUF1127 family)